MKKIGSLHVIHQRYTSTCVPTALGKLTNTEYKSSCNWSHDHNKRVHTLYCTVYLYIVYGFIWQFTNTYTINGYLQGIWVLTLEYGYFNSECVLTRSTDTCTYTEYRQLQAKYWFIRLYGYLYISSILHVVVIETLFTGTFTLHRYS